MGILSSHIQCLAYFSTLEGFLLSQGHLNVISPSVVELFGESYPWLTPSRLTFHVTFPIFPLDLFWDTFRPFCCRQSVKEQNVSGYRGQRVAKEKKKNQSFLPGH